MANVHDTVKVLLTRHPARFTHAGEVLHFLLCTPHSTYQWENGELVDIYGELDVQDVNMDTSALQVLGNTEALSWVFGTIDPETIMPQTAYAPISKIPEDITPDWAEAVAKLKPILEATGWKL